MEDVPTCTCFVETRIAAEWLSWVGLCRRSGKPTSLGCFDQEEQAARAYDKMMLWCELHNKPNMKPGVTNFPYDDYAADMPWLQKVNQVRSVTSPLLTQCHPSTHIPLRGGRIL